jgi:RNA polymerase-interacting CarD/CdnL/TRCF family regulator
MAEYKCKYCGEKFEKPVYLALHVRSKHKRAKKRAKKAAATVTAAGQVNKAIEAVGVLKGLQASPNLSDAEKKLLGDVAKTVEGLIPKSK